MQPVPTYVDLPVVFSAATQVEIPDPTIDTGYNEGTALPTEHFSWLEYKISKKIDELATSTLSLLGEFDSYLTSRGVAPSGASVTQFQTALAAQIAGASVASATTAAACSGNAATADKLKTARTIGGVSFDGTQNINLPGVNAEGNQNTSGRADRANKIITANAGDICLPGSYIKIDIATSSFSYVIEPELFTVPSGKLYIGLYIV